MTLNDFYEQMGVQYKEVLGRLANNEGLVRKYLNKFKEDKTYGSLEEAMAEKDWNAIFRQAHTLKGVSSNLSLMGVLKYSSEIVAAIRAEEKERVPELMESLRREYQRTIELIDSLN